MLSMNSETPYLPNKLLSIDLSRMVSIFKVSLLNLIIFSPMLGTQDLVIPFLLHKNDDLYHILLKDPYIF